MTREEIGKAIAQGMQYEHKNKEIASGLVDNIVNNFNLLANMQPHLALQVLESLNEQITEEEADLIMQSKQDSIEAMGEQIGAGLALED